MICVPAALTTTPVAGAAPKSTVASRVKPVPVIVTGVPPAAAPVAGLMLLTTGAATYVNWSAAEMAEWPEGANTFTSTVPAALAGL